MQQNDPQRSGIDRAVVDRRQEQVAFSVGGPTNLVQDFSRFGGVRRVGDGRLPTGQGTQSPLSQTQRIGHHHPRGPERVPSKQREVPRSARRSEDVRLRQWVDLKQVLEVAQIAPD